MKKVENHCSRGNSDICSNGLKLKNPCIPPIFFKQVFSQNPKRAERVVKVDITTKRNLAQRIKRLPDPLRDPWCDEYQKIMSSSLTLKRLLGWKGLGVIPSTC